MSMSDYTELVERAGGQRGNTFYERMAQMLEKTGIRHGRVGPETEGGVHYFPRYMTKEGKAWYTGLEESMGGRIFGAGNSLDDYSPSLMTRHLTGGDVKIKDLEFHFPVNATTRDLNTEFRRVTGSAFNLFEEDFDKASARYIQNLAHDIGEMVVAKRLNKSATGMVRSYGDHEAVKEIVNEVATKSANEKTALALKAPVEQHALDIELAGARHGHALAAWRALSRSRAAKTGITSSTHSLIVFFCSSNGRLKVRPRQYWSTPAAS